MSRRPVRDVLMVRPAPAAAAAETPAIPGAALDPVRRGLLAALLGGGAAVGLGGCVGLGDTGPVVGGRPVGGAANPIRITVFAQAPAHDAPPQAIVDGFLEACTVPGPDYGAARSYLTETAARGWDPAVSVTVYDGTRLAVTRGPVQAVAGPVPTAGATPSPGASDALRTADAGRPAVGHQVLPLRTTPEASARVRTVPVRRTTVHLTAPAVGSVDRRGGWTTAAPTRSFAAGFQLLTVGGQWRIASVPAGLVVSADDFTRVWPSYRLYFPAPGVDTLVPDPVYLPDRGSAATQLVTALLGGPSSWLAPVVTRPLGSRVRLGPAGVAVSAAGVATVDLVGVGTLSAGAARLVAAQLAQTLAQLSSVTDVAVTTDGAPLTIGGVAAEQAVTKWQQYSADVLPTTATGVEDLAVLRAGPGRAGTALWRGTPGALRQVPLPAVIARGARPAWVATDPLGTRLLFVDSLQERLVEVSAAAVEATVRPLAVGARMVRPQIDRRGLVWLLDFPGAAVGGRLRVVAPDGLVQPVTVDTSALRGSGVRRAVLARDGQRAAVVLRSAAGDVLALTRVARGASVVLERSRPLLGPVGAILDVAWADAVTLLVLQRGTDGAVSVSEINSDGSAPVSLGRPLRDSTSLTAGPAGRPALVGTASGQLLAQQEFPRWTKSDVGYAPVFPG